VLLSKNSTVKIIL